MSILSNSLFRPLLSYLPTPALLFLSVLLSFVYFLTISTSFFEAVRSRDIKVGRSFSAKKCKLH